MIRGDVSFQMNFMYDSWRSENYRQFLMPYVMYQRRQDIDSDQARDLFKGITILDERMKLILVICVIIGGILISGGGSLLILTCFRNRQRIKLLRELKKEEDLRKQTQSMRKRHLILKNDLTGEAMTINPVNGH